MYRDLPAGERPLRSTGSRAGSDDVTSAHESPASSLIHNDPVVLDMLAQFKTARIVPGSIKPH